MTGSLTGVVAF